MYKNIKTLLFFCAVLLFSNNALAQNNIYRLGSKSLPDKLQIIVDVEKMPVFRAFPLSNPVRVVVDIKAQAATTYQNNLNFKRRGVTLVRTGMQDDDTVRLVLDLNRNYYWKAYSVAADARHKVPRLIIDIYDGKKRRTATVKNGSKSASNIALESFGDNGVARKPKQSVASVFTPVKVPVDKTTKNSALTVGKKPAKITAKVNELAIDDLIVRKPIPTQSVATIKKPEFIPKKTTAKPPKQRETIVVIDPGHGGKDSGAVGKYGTKEKTVVLQIAKRLKNKIDAMPGMRAKLTRRTDRYISLRGRLRLARKYKADLFVSIHADAARNRTAQGASAYILSNRGASSESARWLARRENAVDLKYGVDIGDYDRDVSNMIMQIQQDATIESSHLLAKKTIRQMKGIGKLHKSRVERAGFAVLKSPDIPSMLVETAFITNPSEERKLNSSSYQNQLAEAIAKGIKNYFDTHASQKEMAWQ